MGVIDRLRSLARSASGLGGTEQGAPDPGVFSGSIGEQRGDFMMLPPLGQTFGAMARLQHPISDFLVTHRATALTNEPLTHGADSGPMGLIAARAQRRPRRSSTRSSRDALMHRTRDDDGITFDEAGEEQVEFSLPPRPAPRRLAATAKPAPVRPPAQPSAGGSPSAPLESAPSLATPLMPSRAEVGRAVRGPVVRPAVGRTAEGPEVLVGNVIEPRQQVDFVAPQMPPSTLASAPDSAPVLRRRASRGRINAPIEPVDPDAALIEQALADFVGTAGDEANRDAPYAGGVESASALLGVARVRGAAVPEAAPSSASESGPAGTGGVPPLSPPGRTTTARPMPSTPPADSVASAIGPMSGREGTVAQPLAVSPRADSVASAIGPMSGREGTAAQPLAVSRRADSVASATDPMQRGVTRAIPLDVPAPRSSGVDAPLRTEATRPTLGSRPSLVSAGATGIQRRARDKPGGMRAATPTGPRATTPGAGSLSAGPAERPASGGSRSIAVPEQVRQAVRDSVGTAPSHVTVHEGGRAEALTRSVNAEAFTRDGEIFLAADAPLDSMRGQQLLAHELTHVVQQRAGTEQMPAEHTRAGQDLEAGARRAEGRLESRQEAHSTLHHRGSVANAPAVPQMVAGDGVQRSARTASQPVGSPAPIDSSPALSRGGPQPMNFLDDNWRIEVGQRPDGMPTSSMSQSEVALSSAPPITKDGKSGRLRDLERQAHELYPLIRQRLRAELVRDKERRGRMSREWG